MATQKINIVLPPEIAYDEERLLRHLCRISSVSPADVGGMRILSRSIDARQRQIKVQITAELYVGEPKPALSYPAPEYHDVTAAKHSVVVVGSGPAGLFAALHLLEHGVKPIILERGADVSQRKIDIAQINRNVALNANSNYCFGEGGAGTFSDGKLYTRSNKRGNIHRILEIFHYHGAADSILYEAHPHIGSDRLPSIIRHMRQTILDCGGGFHFRAQVERLLIKDGAVIGCRTTDGGEYHADAVILATGHSAHDIYGMLLEQGLPLESKGFAIGVRAEHPQALIDSIQYHRAGRGPYLPAAAYRLVTQASGRGVYSFCMCPGGHIVPASTEPELCVVNGMSASHRNSPYANSGIVVEVRPEDIPAEFTKHGALAGLMYQRHIERLARKAAKGQPFAAPAQRLADFCKGRLSATLPQCSFVPGIVSSPMHEWMPEGIRTRLQMGFSDFDRKMRGYMTREAVIVGVESRSSSPVRIPRDGDTLQHIACQRLYPAGEGAGYAGGITSSAMDGINVAQKIIAAL